MLRGAPDLDSDPAGSEVGSGKYRPDLRNYPVPDRSGDGVLFSINFFVSLLARLRENSWTDLHEIFREGVESPWDNLITFLVNSEKPRDAAMQHGGEVCCALAPQPVMI